MITLEQINVTTTASAVNGSAEFILEDSVGHLIRRAHQRASATFMAVLANYNFTPTQFFAMARLLERGQLSQNRLGRLTAMDPATIQGVIRRLYDRGYIERTPDPTDRRRMNLELSAEGHRIVTQLVDEVDAVNGQILAPLEPSEREQFQRLLKRIV